jgi:hypothetical protein
VHPKEVIGELSESLLAHYAGQPLPELEEEQGGDGP